VPAGPSPDRGRERMLAWRKSEEESL
jgi:hypothetical protein